MREWQRAIAAEAARAAEVAAPAVQPSKAVSSMFAAADPQTLAQITSLGISLGVGVVVFLMLSLLKPPFVESAKERPFDIAGTNYGVVFVMAAASSLMTMVITTSLC